MWHAYWSLSMHLPDILKIFQTIKKLWSAQEFELIRKKFVQGR